VSYLSERLALVSAYQDKNGGKPAEVDNFSDLRDILSKSSARDAYCKSALYFAFTGRGKVWIVDRDPDYLILVRHPNVDEKDEILLVFFPFITSAAHLVEQVRILCNFRPFLNEFQKVHLARIPASVVPAAMEHARSHCRLEITEETKLDWAYPSYDVCLKGLVKPEGGKLRTYRKKVRKFCDRGIEVLGPKDLTQRQLQNAVIQVNNSWIRTKSNGDTSPQSRRLLRELIDPYRALAQLNSNFTLEIDGLILRRGGSHVAFSLWERPRNVEDVVPCIAALPHSHEKGLSEYLYYCIAHRLTSEGYERMCIGGSETASLDHFKQKLDPIDVHALKTIRLFL
jgi:hypothetical protein